MLDLEMSLPKVELPKALGIIFSGDPVMKPVQWSGDEDGERLRINSVDQINKTTAGFFWAPECAYEVSVPEAGEVTIFASSESVVGLHSLFVNLARLRVNFGYACEREEREHRNRIVRRMSYGVHEAWVGRDFSRYLPGLYWLVSIPVDMQERLGISVDRLGDLALELEWLSNRNLFVRLYEHPHDWWSKAARVDEWCRTSPGTFSKTIVEDAMDDARSFIEASTLVKAWR